MWPRRADATQIGATRAGNVTCALVESWAIVGTTVKVPNTTWGLDAGSTNCQVAGLLQAEGQSQYVVTASDDGRNYAIAAKDIMLWLPPATRRRLGKAAAPRMA